jgi:hypothetical protein
MHVLAGQGGSYTTANRMTARLASTACTVFRFTPSSFAARFTFPPACLNARYDGDAVGAWVAAPLIPQTRTNLVREVLRRLRLK